jgi:hypothetical protein
VRWLLLACPLGSLQRVDFLRRFFDLDLDMCGSRAFSGPPFAGRVRINPAVLTRFARDDLGAPFAFIDDRQAAAPVESTALLRHEAALDAALGGLTNHVSLLFFDVYGESEKNRPALNPVPGQAGRLFPFFKARFDSKIVNRCQEKNAPFTDRGKSNKYQAMKYLCPIVWIEMRIGAPMRFRSSSYLGGIAKKSQSSEAEWIDFTRHSC